ncbi:uncharacterized protein LOC110035387 [Phalaenopsis equestris]|uniref:uncharacterized protein LOC110035387 n=1 Tax=Phalaenopsis equestris TaxID=78828 RepID=UPI0009E36080|nr:uncharacterized protein LOC110035387 [Phalaenopsis equestris]
MHRLLAKLGRPLLSSSLHCLPPSSPNHLPVHFLSSIRSMNSSLTPHVPICPARLLTHSSPFIPVFQFRHFATKKVKRSRAPDTPVISKVKKYKLKAYSSFKYRFRTMNDGLIRRWRAGKRHNAHLKSKKSKRRLRKPEIVHLAYAKVIKKLNFAG